MKQSLYVVAHKEFASIFPPDRKIMMVGAKRKIIPANYYSDFDESKENISHKNFCYCELTGLYFMCKHDDAEILGLEHYRRAFVKGNSVFGFRFLKPQQIDRLLNRCDLIVPKKSQTRLNVYDYYCENHVAEDLEITKSVLLEKYPNYVSAFDDVMLSHEAYFANMFIAKSSVIKAYADWLFDVLFDVEKRIDISKRSPHQQRVFGFLSERLFNVYLTKNCNLKTKEQKVAKIDSGMPTIWNKIKSALAEGGMANLFRKVKNKFYKK